MDKYEIAWGGRGASAKVPLLEYGDTLVVESSDVAKFTAQNIGNNTDMYPFEDAEFIDQFIDAFDLTIQDYYSFLTAMSDTEVEAAKDPLRESLNTLEEFFSSDDGPFVLGDKFSVAESFAAPWVHRFSIVLPHFRNTTVNEIVSSPKVQRWLDTVLERQSVQDTNGPTNYVLSSTQGYFVRYLTLGSPSTS